MSNATLLATSFFDLKITKTKILPGEIDKNYYLHTDNGEEYILKIASDKTPFELLEMQNELMLYLEKNIIDLPLPKVIENKFGDTLTILQDANGQPRYMRLLTWMSGRIWATVTPHSPDLVRHLGEVCATINKGLEGFYHPAAKRDFFKWDNTQAIWTKDYLKYMQSEEQKEIVTYFIAVFENEVLPVLPTLRQAVVHNDMNDYNIVVNDDLAQPKVLGCIDFGDAVYTQVVNDLAITAAYAMMHKEDPLATAVELVSGFHSKYPLSERELAVLFPLIAMRLVVSVSNSAFNKINEPENEYLLVSEQPAWDLLKKMRTISSSFAHYAFRDACEMEAVPHGQEVQDWLKANQANFASIVEPNLKTIPKYIFDFSVGSLDLGNNPNFENVDLFHRKVLEFFTEKKVNVGIGRYNEVRPIYTTDSYLIKGNEGPEWRSVHIGLDVFMKAGSPVFAPLEGEVFSFQHNDADRDYGPTIILAHRTDKHRFFTLYGHLSLESLEDLRIGMPITKGQKIATMGDMPINGNWSPHLHFQIILDMLDKEGDFAGVVFPRQRNIFKSLCPDPNLMIGMGDAKLYDEEKNQAEIMTIRNAYLGRSLSLSYNKPLKIVRGYMQYLYDENGRRFLDTVNNVPHVGHQHPRVVHAAKKQIEVLNTNTRYLHENIVNFAEELCATLPDELCVCHFVNSGSEANELALRMAKTYTQQKDMLVVEVGYHGNTNACVDISSYKFDGKGGSGAPDWVHVMPIPDTYRGLHKDKTEAGKKYADYLKKSIEKIQYEGRNIAGFLCESILSCGGQIVLPPDYLKEAFHHVRAAGGLCIMDEVQVGFGRVGSHFWGFELQDVVPDIVTMGKPIGNGHPLGAVVTTRAVADAFVNGMEYFNTFGGNPVSCAIGREVLAVVKDEKLQSHALKMGQYLTKGLNELKAIHPIIGDVRGSGLFLGFELVKDRTTLEPAPEQTTYLANRMRLHGILNSTDGLYHNVIKIKPPMAFNTANANFLLEMLDKVLQEDFMKV